MLILPQMEIIDASHIEGWPEDVVLGVSEITDKISLEILTKKDRAEFERFSNPKRKAEFLTARQLFRTLLEEMNFSENEVELLKKKSGKPYANYKGKTIHVSFSHSPKKVFCAISTKHQIGLDVEATNRIIDYAVVKRILNENEWKAMREEEPVKLWTIKEAAVKCLGTGLRTNLKELTIVKNEKKRFSVRFNNEKLFEICSFNQSDHQITLAYQIQQI